MFPRKIIILIGLVSFFESSLASEIDYSKWSYDDLSHAAAEMAGDKNYKGALKFFDLAVSAAPNNPEGYLNRGGMYAILKNNDKAIQDEQRAIELAKEDTRDNIFTRCIAHQNLSAIYLKSNQFLPCVFL